GGHGVGEPGAREAPRHAEPSIECHPPAVVGIGRPGEAAQRRRGGAAQEQQGETGEGRGRCACEERRGAQPGAPRQRAPHQLAAATVLISIVCNPLTIRCIPVTVTLPSAYCSSFEFWGSPGLELTGR